MNSSQVDWVLPVVEIAELINRLAGPKKAESGLSEKASNKDARELEEEARLEDVESSKPSAYSCPDCGGVLWEIDDGEFGRFRCRVGHGFTPDGLLAAQSDELEHALWESLKVLEERASLLRRLSGRMSGHLRSAGMFSQTAEEMEEHAATLRRLLYEGKLFDTAGATVDAPGPPAPEESADV